MAESDDQPKSRLAGLAPPGMGGRHSVQKPEPSPVDDKAELTAELKAELKAASMPRFGLSPQVQQQQLQRQEQQTTALQQAANAAFGSVAALDADTQASLQRKALSMVCAGLAVLRLARADAPFKDADQFRAWIGGENAEALQALAASLAQTAAAPVQPPSLIDQVRDSRMLAVAAEVTPRPWVADYWARLGTTQQDRRPGVFLSYARVEFSQARELKSALGPEVLVVLDADYLRLGETWWDVIGGAIRHCRMTLVLVSPHSVQSENVKKEIAKASSEGHRTKGRHRLVPIFLAAVDDLPMPLEGSHGLFVDAAGGMRQVALQIKADLAT